MKMKGNFFARLDEKPLNGEAKTNFELLLKRHDIAQKRIAAYLNVSSSTISAWAQGTTTIPKEKKFNIKKFFDHLNRSKKLSKEHDLEIMLLISNHRNLDHWKTYMQSLGEPLHEDWEKLLLILNDIGVPIPETPSMIENDLSQYRENSQRVKLFGQLNKDAIETLKEVLKQEDLHLSHPLQDYKQHKPFDNLVKALLINLNILESWCDTFLPKTKEGELTNTSKKIQNRLLDVAFLKTKVVNLVAETGTDVDELIEKNNEIRSEVNNLIGLLCDELLEKGSSIRTDYFEFVKLSPNQLQKRISNYEVHKSNKEPHINDYLRYGEREIASRVDQTLDWQRRIFQKIETLTITQNEIIERIHKNEQLLKQLL